MLAGAEVFRIPVTHDRVVDSVSLFADGAGRDSGSESVDHARNRIVSRIFLMRRGSALRKTLEPTAAGLLEDMFATLSMDEYRLLSEQVARLLEAIPKPAGLSKTRKRS